MNILELRKYIKNKNIPKLLIFIGEEFYVKNIYIEQIRKTLNAQIIKLDSSDDFLNKPKAKSLFKSNIKIYSILDDTYLKKNEKAWEQIKKTKEYLILNFNDSPDKKFINYFESDIVMFESMSINAIVKNINKSYNISTENAKIIAEGCNKNLGRCLSELDKIRSFNISDDEAFEKCLKDGFCLDKDITIKEMVYAFIRGEKNTAFEMYDTIKQTEVPLRILAFFYNMFRNLLICKSITDTRNIEQNTGLNYYIYKGLKPYLSHFSLDYLEYALYVISDIEKGIKTGYIDSVNAIDIFLCRLS